MSANINEVHLTWESCAQVRRLLRDTHSIFELEKGQDAPTINVKFASLNSEVLLPLMKALRAEGGDEVLMVTVPDLVREKLGFEARTLLICCPSMRGSSLERALGWFAYTPACAYMCACQNAQC